MSALCLFPPSTVKPVEFRFGAGAATAGAALEELAAEALGASAGAPDIDTAGAGAGAAGTGGPFMSKSAGCVSASSMGA
eukprot:3892630-Alexandrium_andersonii.AAC.1